MGEWEGEVGAVTETVTLCVAWCVCVCAAAGDV